MRSILASGFASGKAKYNRFEFVAWKVDLEYRGIYFQRFWPIDSLCSTTCCSWFLIEHSYRCGIVGQSANVGIHYFDSTESEGLWNRQVHGKGGLDH